MVELRFNGSSDDTFGYERYDSPHANDTGDDHDDCATGTLRAYSVVSGNDGMVVTGQYAPIPVPDGTWVIGITLLEEDKELPDWPMEWTLSDMGYSPELRLICPDDIVVTLLNKIRGN